MTLKAVFILFYVIFLSIFVTFQVQLGVDILDIDQSELISIGEVIPDPTGENILTIFISLILNVIAFTVQAFFILISINIVNPAFAIINIVFILPFTIVMVYILLEFIRGIG